jgi:hypothetical protein
MSSHDNGGTHYDNHQRAAELHDGAAHAHRAADQHGQQEHLTPHELSRQAHESSQESHRQDHAAAPEQVLETFGHRDIAALAYELWQARGCPEGSSDEDWFQAVRQLRLQAQNRK